MPMGLSRAFTPDKSSDFAQFVWENITHPQFFILQTVGGKRVTKLVNMKTLMLIDLSRVFTPDKSCAFPQLLRKMSLNSSFLSCGPYGKHVTNRLWLVLNLLDLESACRLDSTLRFQIAPSIPREPAPAPIEHYFESDIELRDLTTKVFAQGGTGTGKPVHSRPKTESGGARIPQNPPKSVFFAEFRKGVPFRFVIQRTLLEPLNPKSRNSISFSCSKTGPLLGVPATKRFIEDRTHQTGFDAFLLSNLASRWSRWRWLRSPGIDFSSGCVTINRPNVTLPPVKVWEPHPKRS